MLPVALNYPFLNAPLVFSNVYLTNKIAAKPRTNHEVSDKLLLNAMWGIYCRW